MAEGKGFEPSIPFGKHAFQACALNHSATPPRTPHAIGKLRRAATIQGLSGSASVDLYKIVAVFRRTANTCVNRCDLPGKQPLYRLKYMAMDTNTGNKSPARNKGDRAMKRIIGLILFIGGAVVLGADLWRLATTEELFVTAVGDLWFSVHPASLNLLQAGLERHVWPPLWDPVTTTVLLWPASLVGLFLGVLLGGLVPKKN